jgi:hypothetical protein
MTQFTCKGVKQINNRISLNMTFTFTIRISRRFSSARDSVPPVNFQNLPPVKKIKHNKILTYILRSIFLEIPHLESRADEKRREIRMVKVNVIFNDIRLKVHMYASTQNFDNFFFTFTFLI